MPKAHLSLQEFNKVVCTATLFCTPGSKNGTETMAHDYVSALS